MMKQTHNRFEFGIHDDGSITITQLDPTHNQGMSVHLTADDARLLLNDLRLASDRTIILPAGQFSKTDSTKRSGSDQR
jgi:hypothetical protein